MATSPFAAADHQVDILRTAQVVVASKPGCQFCKKAKADLQAAGIQFVDLDASRSATVRQLVREVAGSATVPQVFVGGVSVGGSDALTLALQSGSFAAALKAAEGKPALPAQLLQAVEDSWEQEAARARVQSSDPGASTSAVLDAVGQLLAAPGTGVPTSSHRVGGRTLPCFTGQQLTDWLLQHSTAPPLGSPSEAVAWLSSIASAPGAAGTAAAQLLAANVVSVAVDSPPYGSCLGAGAAAASAAPPVLLPSQRYFLVSAASEPLPKGEPLNTAFWWNAPARPATQVAEQLRDLIVSLYDRHLSQDGRKVDYSAIRTDPLFARYTRATAELQRVDLTGLDRASLCALFINLYNALIVHALAVYGAPANAAQRSQFFKRDAAYCIAGHTYTADDMEHGVLRDNAQPFNVLSVVGLGALAPHQFKAGDPRASKVVSPLDPRIHCALVCGAKSCPPISVYTPDNLEEGLQAAAEAFCGGEVVPDVGSRTVTLSKIFQWYGVDFGRNDTAKLTYLAQFLKGQARTDLEALLSGGKFKVTYKPYDWGLNE